MFYYIKIIDVKCHRTPGEGRRGKKTGSLLKFFQTEHRAGGFHPLTLHLANNRVTVVKLILSSIYEYHKNLSRGRPEPARPAALTTGVPTYAALATESTDLDIPTYLP